MEELTIKNLRPPHEKNLEKDLEWFCNSFGIMRERDKEKSGFRIFKILLESAKQNKGLQINEIKDEVELSRTTVVHHLKYLEESGIVIERERRYELRRRSLHKIVDEIEKDILRSINEIKEMAKELDDNLGMSYRE